MKIIEFHRGCNTRPVGCFGPFKDFVTIFDSELRFLGSHLVASLAIGILPFIVLSRFRKNSNPLLRLLVSVGVTGLAFFVSAYLFPVRVIY